MNSHSSTHFCFLLMIHLLDVDFCHKKISMFFTKRQTLDYNHDVGCALARLSTCKEFSCLYIPSIHKVKILWITIIHFLLNDHFHSIINIVKQAEYQEGDALDALQLKRYCCRRMLLGHVVRLLNIKRKPGHTISLSFSGPN